MQSAESVRGPVCVAAVFDRLCRTGTIGQPQVTVTRGENAEFVKPLSLLLKCSPLQSVHGGHLQETLLVFVRFIQKSVTKIYTLKNFYSGNLWCGVL